MITKSLDRIKMSQQTFSPGSKVVIDEFNQSYNRTLATVVKYSKSKKMYTVTAHDKVILKVKECSIFYVNDRPPLMVCSTFPPTTGVQTESNTQESQPKTEANDVVQEVCEDVQNLGKIKHCAACCKPHNPPTLTSCNGCHKVYYCSRACQKNHWRGNNSGKHGGHKLACKILKKQFPKFKREERLSEDKCIICNEAMPYFQNLEVRVFCCGQRGHDACFHGYDGFVNDAQNKYRAPVKKCPGCGSNDLSPMTSQNYITKCAQEKIPWAMSKMASGLISLGDPESKRQARQILEEAAQSGDAECLTRLGHELATGYPQDFKRSEKLYREAIGKGWPEAYARFGDLVMFGQSSITSMQGRFELAHALYLAYLQYSLTIQHHLEVVTNIGRMYYHGDIGIGSINDSFNYNMSKKYFEFAIARGEPKAARCLAILDGSQPRYTYQGTIRTRRMDT